MIEDYITLREAVEQKMLSEDDCVYAVYLLTIILKKMLYDSNGGGHFDVNPETVLVSKREGEKVKVKFIGRFSPASDVYSIGMLMAFMLQGYYPFDTNESMPKTEILKVAKGYMPRLEVPAPLRTIIGKALSKKSNERYKDVEELGLALMDYMGMEKPKRFCCFSDDNKDKRERAHP